jgi:hypothetical protein
MEGSRGDLLQSENGHAGLRQVTRSDRRSLSSGAYSRNPGAEYDESLISARQSPLFP